VGDALATMPCHGDGAFRFGKEFAENPRPLRRRAPVLAGMRIAFAK
jgi:hypothetical protein